MTFSDLQVILATAKFSTGQSSTKESLADHILLLIVLHNILFCFQDSVTYSPKVIVYDNKSRKYYVCNREADRGQFVQFFYLEDA